MTAARMRIRYSVRGKVRFISHLDLMRAFFRACIKGGIPVDVSQGFSPHLKISFGPPLSVGMTSSGEYLDMFVYRPVSAERLRLSLSEGLPDGIAVEEVYEASGDAEPLSVYLNRAVYIVYIPEGAGCGAAEVSGDRLILDLPVGQKGSVRPIDVIKSMWPEKKESELRLWLIHREKLYNERDIN